MYKIAAFIEFNKIITKKILNRKKEVEKKFGNQIYLKHPVHLTLFTIHINKIDQLKKLYINDKKNKSKPFSISVTKPGVFYNDPLTGGHTIFYHIRKNKKISELQLRHLKKINKNLNVLKRNIKLFKNNILRKNFKEFGFPFTGKIWIPHTTIASIKNLKRDDKYIKEFLTKKIRLNCFIKEIKFYKIIKDRHELLFNVKDF